MGRTKQDLRSIAEEYQQRAALKSGLALIAFVFDTRGPTERPVSIVLHGVEPSAAVRMLRHHADMIEQQMEDDPANKPLIIKPVH